MAVDINNPEDGNKIVSPENLHTDPTPDFVDMEVETVAPEPDEPPRDEKGHFAKK